MQLMFWRKPRYHFDIVIAKTMIDFSRLAYKDEPEIREELERMGFEFQAFLNDDETDTQGFVATDSSKIYVAFRGTESIVDFFTDILIVKTPFPPTKRWFFKPKAHFGFVNSYEGVKKQLLDLISTLLLSKPYEVYITGHSLGGALATLAAIDIRERFRPHVCVYTFGSPKVGNRWFKWKFNRSVRNSFRVVHDDDIVAWLPPMGFHHVKTLVFIDSNGNIDINPSFPKRIIESMDDVFATITGSAIKDHFSRYYDKWITKNYEEYVSKMAKM